ncbi:hypothetical protein LPJ61_005056, partial [Coemansia biformis]
MNWVRPAGSGSAQPMPSVQTGGGLENRRLQEQHVAATQGRSERPLSIRSLLNNSSSDEAEAEGVQRVLVAVGAAASRIVVTPGLPAGELDDGDGEGDCDDDDDDDEYSMGTAEEHLSPPCSNRPFASIRMPQLEEEVSEFFSDRVDVETREAVRYYFDYFYPLSPMFNPSLFIRRVVRGQVDPLLIDAMKATTARVVTRKTGRVVDGKALALSVKQRILVQLEQPTEDLVRVIVVMTLLAGSQGEYVSYNSLICLAASLVVRMGWHKLDLYKRPPPASFDEWVGLEVKRRIFWLVYQIDSYQAMLTGRPMTIAEDSVYVLAPCSDYEWDSLHVNRHIIPGISGEQTRTNLYAAGGHNQRSSRSSSESRSSLVPPLRPNQHEIVATGAFSHSFMALCELTSIIAKINSFLCEAKASRPSQLQFPSSAAAVSAAAAAAAASSAADVAHGRDMPFPAVDFMGVPESTGTTGLVYP